MLVLTRPDLIAQMHDAFFEVGVDVVETATFGAFAGPARRVRHRRQDPRDQPQGRADRARGRRRLRRLRRRLDRPRHEVRVARPDPLRRPPRRLRGAVPRPARGRRRPAARRDAVRPARPEGGGDRRPPGDGGDRPRGAAPGAGHDRAHRPHAARHRDRRRAVRASTRCSADVVGLNCATGPSEMTEHLRHLSQHSRMPISCLPNAGLPSVVDGKMHYDLTPEQLADFHHALHHRARRVTSSAAAAARRPSTCAPSSRRCRDLDARAAARRCTSRARRRSTRSRRSTRTSRT